MTTKDPSDKSSVDSLRAALTDALLLEGESQKDALTAIQTEAQIELIAAVDRLTAAVNAIADRIREAA